MLPGGGELLAFLAFRRSVGRLLWRPAILRGFTTILDFNVGLDERLSIEPLRCDGQRV
jgi:hypothetical protein